MSDNKSGEIGEGKEIMRYEMINLEPDGGAYLLPISIVSRNSISNKEVGTCYVENRRSLRPSPRARCPRRAWEQRMVWTAVVWLRAHARCCSTGPAGAAHRSRSCGVGAARRGRACGAGRARLHSASRSPGSQCALRLSNASIRRSRACRSA